MLLFWREKNEEIIYKLFDLRKCRRNVSSILDHISFWTVSKKVYLVMLTSLVP